MSTWPPMLELGTIEQTFVRRRQMNELDPMNMSWSPEDGLKLMSVLFASVLGSVAVL